MTKSSAVNAREAAEPRSTASGGLLVRGETLTIQTQDRVELTDVTDRLSALVRDSAVREGLVSVWSMHTTCAVFINELQKALHADIKRLLEEMVERDADWMHNDPGSFRLRSAQRGRASAGDAPRPQPDAADQQRRGRAGTVAACPRGGTRRPACAIAARQTLGVADHEALVD